MEQNNAPLGIALILASTFVFASQDAITKTLASTYAAPQLMWVRYALYLVLALYLSSRRRPLKSCIKSNVPLIQVARSLLIVTEMGMFVLSIRILSMAEIHSIFATSPLMVTAIAGLFLGEKVGIRRWSAVLAGFIGVLIILRPGMGAMQPGALLGLATAFLFAIYTVLTRWVARHDDSETSMVYMGVTGFVTTSLIAPFFWTAPTASDWFLLLGLATAGAVGHSILIKALEVAPASTLQPFNYTLLVFAVFYGWLIFDNLPDPWTIAGAGIIVASGLYVFYRERARKR